MASTNLQEQLFAVIDSGSNSFSLCIYERQNEQLFKRIYKENYFVELLEGGSHRIEAAAFGRALRAYQLFAETLCYRQIKQVKAVATAAFRSSSNSAELVAQIWEETKIGVEIISGEQEAQLIYEGVRLAAPIPSEGYGLIMDIGGGSVEFILCNQKGRVWAESFMVGAAVLYNQYPLSDPSNEEEIGLMQQKLSVLLANLWEQIKIYPPKLLIGASGTFDVLLSLVGKRKGQNPYELFPAARFMQDIYPPLRYSSLQEREAMPLMPAHRAKMLVGILVLIELVLQKTGVDMLAVSDYALREGLAWNMMQPDNSPK